MIRTSAPEGVAHTGIRGKSEVAKFDLRAVLTAHNVLWFEITVIDALVVTMLDGIKNLHEDLADQIVLPAERMTLDDSSEQIATRAIVQNQVDEPVIFNNFMQVPIVSGWLGLHEHLDGIFLWSGVRG
ncbi:hypothetical protein SCP_1103380 [Sparassis crispa]|uniref:Uncharacterized protein n=1 Tax=Sparassis crispa TaxID=139825 RepID=A0A401GZR7_9APHY|nr:hypothetical protein SCP_1103380 [Sparassis crispa]GBE87661.1 hypothetical protein SCP_1103380 [Sparassis crispa]